MAVESQLYDGRGQLWRVGEGFAVNNYEQGTALYAANSLNDLISGRYLVMALQNESKRGIDFTLQAKSTDFTPAALRNAGIR
ncbi:hypothetical protein D3C76_1461060 [compost metagenome]